MYDNNINKSGFISIQIIKKVILVSFLVFNSYGCSALTTHLEQNKYKNKTSYSIGKFIRESLDPELYAPGYILVKFRSTSMGEIVSIEILDHSDGFTEEQISNLTRIVKSLKEIPSYEHLSYTDEAEFFVKLVFEN